MSDFTAYLEVATSWYESHRAASGHVNTNVMNSGLIVSRMVRDGLPVDDSRFYSQNRSQVRGLSGPAIGKILAENGEERTFTSEGGRTSRRTLQLADEYRGRLNGIRAEAGLDVCALGAELEQFFTARVKKDFFDKQRIDVAIDPTKPMSEVVGDILSAAAARADKPTGTVLQHLVGAKLQLRFPHEDIGVDRANAADQQTDREGDFQLGTTAFHVTVAPAEKLIDRCVQNRKAEFRPVIVTPRGVCGAARQLAQVNPHDMGERVAVLSAEDFVGTNIEEISVYEEAEIRRNLARLIRAYNDRIEQIETDKSLMINEPAWLAALAQEDA
jgi:hypothetical protein